MCVTVSLDSTVTVVCQAGVIHASLMYVTCTVCADQEGSDVDLDREFLQGLRELKFLSEKECVDEHKLYVTTNIYNYCDIKDFF